MKKVIEDIRDKLDRLDQHQDELETELETKRFQLEKVNSLIEKLEEIQQQQPKE